MKKCKIYYFRFPNCKDKDEKLDLIKNADFEKLAFDRVIPDEKANWINQTDNDFDTLLPVCSKEVKSGRSQEAIFKLFSLGIVTSRDDWVYDFDETNLINKIEFFIGIYNKQDINSSPESLDYSIKWSRSLKNDLRKGIQYMLNNNLIIESLYRPFTKKRLYFSKQLNEMQCQLPNIFKPKEINDKVILHSIGQRDNFLTLSSKIIPSLDIFMPNSTQCLPLYTYDKAGNRHDNITDWALDTFKSHYQVELTKLDIFHYVYSALHSPHYRQKYEHNLKRDFPRIPFYSDFFQWSKYGKQLMDYHLHYETVEPYPLECHECHAVKIPKAKLKVDKANGIILLDENTYLSGVPREAWQYTLGHRSALEWICDQYKEKKPKDPTIAERFNTYRFADYKEQVIDLLMRVCTVSVKTVKVIQDLSVLD